MKVLVDIGDVELKEVVRQYTEHVPSAVGQGWERVIKKESQWALVAQDSRLVANILFHARRGAGFKSRAGNRIYVDSKEAGERILSALANMRE